jgi:hypothetical protein
MKRKRETSSEKPKKMKQITIPPDVWLIIGYYCKPIAMINLSLTCKELNQNLFQGLEIKERFLLQKGYKETQQNFKGCQTEKEYYDLFENLIILKKVIKVLETVETFQEFYKKPYDNKFQKALEDEDFEKCEQLDEAFNDLIFNEGLCLFKKENLAEYASFIQKLFDKILKKGRCYNQTHIKKICQCCNNRICQNIPIENQTGKNVNQIVQTCKECKKCKSRPSKYIPRDIFASNYYTKISDTRDLQQEYDAKKTLLYIYQCHICKKDSCLKKESPCLFCNRILCNQCKKENRNCPYKDH